MKTEVARIILQSREDARIPGERTERYIFFRELKGKWKTLFGVQKFWRFLVRENNVVEVAGVDLEKFKKTRIEVEGIFEVIEIKNRIYYHTLQ